MDDIDRSIHELRTLVERHQEPTDDPAITSVCLEAADVLAAASDELVALRKVVRP